MKKVRKRSRRHAIDQYMGGGEVVVGDDGGSARFGSDVLASTGHSALALQIRTSSDDLPTSSTKLHLTSTNMVCIQALRREARGGYC